MLAAAQSSETSVAPPMRTKSRATEKSARSLRAKLKHLQALPVAGPDSDLIAAYNEMLAAWRAYYEADSQRAAGTDLDFSFQRAADKAAWKVIRTPANTPDGVLLKIKATGSQVGASRRNDLAWAKKDWVWFKPVEGGSIEEEFIMLLRDDMRRMVRPIATTVVSPDLAALIRIYTECERVADEATSATESSSEHGFVLDRREAHADAAVFAVKMAIVHFRAQSIQDVLAKFSTIRRYVEIEDLGRLMSCSKHGTAERMLWSICADLLALSDKGPALCVSTASGECPVAAMADEFRLTIDLFDKKSDSGNLKNDDLYYKERMLLKASAFEQARSAQGALFQVGVASSLVSEAINNNAWKMEAPEEMRAVQRNIYRLLFSASEALAAITATPKESYAGDNFLNVDPFKDLEG